MRRLSWLVAALLVASFVGTAPAVAYQPQGGALFNTPKPWGGYLANYRIVRHVESAMNHTRPTKNHPKPTIYISTYLLDRSKSVDAMVRACRRGVSVRVLLDHEINNRNSRRLIRVLNSDNVRDKDHDGKPDDKPKRGPCDSKLKKHKHKHEHDGGKGGKGDKHRHGKNAGLVRGQAKSSDPLTAKEAMRSASRPTPAPVTWGKDRSYVKRCIGACRGGGGNMHSKFYLFSRSGKANKVVMVSSSNLNRGGATMGWNEMYTIKKHPKLYDAFARMHRKMTDDKRAGAKKVSVTDGPFVARFFPMKRAAKANDPTLHDLDKIRCRSAFGRTQIFVSMFYWKGRRGNYLTTKFLSLARHGCQVSIVYGAPSVQMATRLRTAAGRSLIHLWDSRWDHNDDGFNEVRTHAKYVLVKGSYGKDRSAHEVLTGSQNWVAGSLSKSDETTLNISLKSAYVAYVHDWSTIQRHSRRLPYHRYGSPARFSGPDYSEPI